MNKIPTEYIHIWNFFFKTVPFFQWETRHYVESSWNAMVHGDAREGKWRGNWRMEWVASTLHTTSEHGVSSITTADTHTSTASSRMNWRPWRFKLTRPFRRKTKSGFCACGITFQTQSTPVSGGSDSSKHKVFLFFSPCLKSSMPIQFFCINVWS